jgi:hypothetical protein
MVNLAHSTDKPGCPEHHIWSFKAPQMKRRRMTGEVRGKEVEGGSDIIAASKYNNYYTFCFYIALLSCDE